MSETPEPSAVGASVPDLPTDRACRSGDADIAWGQRGPADAPPVVLVHSLGLDARMWAPQVEALHSDYRFVWLDLRGHGHSEVPAGPYTIERLAFDVLAVADAAGLGRFDLVGLSIGGQVGQWLALERPDRLRSLVLANTAARIGTAESWAERSAAVRDVGMAALAPTVLSRWFAAGFEAREPERYAYARERFATTSPEGYLGCCAALAASDLGTRVGAIDLPTLVISGTADLPTTPAQTRQLHEAIAGSELVVIDGAAHISNLDAPTRFTAAVGAFLARQR